MNSIRETPSISTIVINLGLILLLSICLVTNIRLIQQRRILLNSRPHHISSNRNGENESNEIHFQEKNQMNSLGPNILKKQRRHQIPEQPMDTSVYCVYFIMMENTFSSDDNSPNSWKMIKDAISKDISRFPLPVNFNEPLSMLQRITEELEYSDLLDRAAQSTDNWEQMAFVAAFTVSNYSTTATRINKPFNPLLGMNLNST